MRNSYPDRMTLRPLDGWPRPVTLARKASPFGAGWSSTMETLDRELWHLSPNDVRQNAASVLQIALRERDFRRSDGMPRADASPTHPGVILNIESKHGPLSYPCDRFTTWQANLRAITLALESLRRVDRYGITDTGQQYTGWAQLESSAMTGDRDSVIKRAREAVYEIALEQWSAEELNAVSLALVYHRAAKITHPDTSPNYDPARWHVVDNAGRVLRSAKLL